MRFLAYISAFVASILIMGANTAWAQDIEEVPFDNGFESSYSAFQEEMEEVQSLIEKATPAIDSMVGLWKSEIDEKNKLIYNLQLAIEQGGWSLSELQLDLMAQRVKNLEAEVDRLRDKYFGEEGEYRSAINKLMAPYSARMEETIENFKKTRSDNKQKR